MIRFWDILVVRVLGDIANMNLDPYFFEVNAPECVIHAVCKEASFEHYGYIFCEAMHPPLLQGYIPNAIFMLDKCLMLGDTLCHSKGIVPHQEGGGPKKQIDRSIIESLEKKILDNPVEFTRFGLQGEARMIAMCYYFMAQAVIERFGQDGKEAMKASLIDMGAQRGKELKDKLEKAGAVTTWANIWDHFDLAYKYAWRMNIEKSDDKLFMADVEYCPMAEIWGELGDEEIGSMYCDNMYTAMFKELNCVLSVSLHEIQ
jgi:hypothetical protein